MYNEVDDIIGFKYNNEVYYYIKNGQNDIIGILDNNYNKIVEYVYDSWGNILEIKDNSNNNIGLINPFRYRSYYYDNETKLYYLNSRYYNSLWGRFINCDGIIIQNKSLSGLNLYMYAMNNPINMFDRDGNFSLGNLWKKVKSFCKKTIELPVKVAINGMAEITGAVGLSNASNLLTNSLENKPKNKKYGNNSDIVKKIKSSPEFKDTIKDVINNNKNSYLYNRCVTIRFDEDKDLKLALHNATMCVSGQINDNSTDLLITIRDRYDYEYWNYRVDKGILTTIINNYAWMFQEMGIINEYDVVIDFDYIVNYN